MYTNAAGKRSNAAPAEVAALLRREVNADTLRYMLAMYWQGRSDKIPAPLMPALQWATENAVPASQPGPSNFSNGQCMFQGADHAELLDLVRQRVKAAIAA